MTCIGLYGVFSLAMAKNHHTENRPAPVVFVVDDETMLLDLAEVILKPEGFTVRTFQSAESALAEYAAAKPPPCAIITDYAMGGMNGMEFIRQCRQLHPHQRTILVSGTVDEDIFANAETKPDCFLSKPYNAEQFVSTVRTLTGY
ncbi:MAG TPA: response regulator [Pseudomonadales bacterium]|nr:response regulator [Pseudomonadales bacterium]